MIRRSIASMRSRWARAVFAVGVFAVLYLPFASKPVHIDDANFLMLAEGAARDPWRPHDVVINWSGVFEPAFGILANPPGIAWYLAPVRRAPEWVLHLWMLPWLALGAWGCWRLVREFTCGDPLLGTTYLLTCPVVVVSAHALTPDLPVFGCMAAGAAGFTCCRRRWPFALLAGCAALFRYSGGAAVPLLIVIGWKRDRWRGVAAATLAAVPIALLAVHDLHAYGRIHLFSMFAAQNDASQKSVWDAAHNLVAGVAMLGGAGVLPVLVWRRESVAGAVAGAAVGLNAAVFSGQSLSQAVPTVLATAAGAAALALALAPRIRQPFLSAWALGGALFFFTVRFAATRYWAAFVPGVALLALRNAGTSRSWLAGGVAANVLVSFGIAIDDQELARGYKSAAERVAATGLGTFSGHWGWQHYLEKAGWKPVERGARPETLHAYAGRADAQLPQQTACLTLVDRFPLPDRWPGPRTYSWLGRAFYHAGGRGSYAPWTLSDEPYDVITVYRSCDASDVTAGQTQ